MYQHGLVERNLHSKSNGVAWIGRSKIKIIITSRDLDARERIETY